MAHLLLVEDDVRLAAMVGDYLRHSGHEVAHVEAAAPALERLARDPFDAVILDGMLPDIDGFEVCRRIRGLDHANAEVGIIMLTARGDPADRVIGLEIGADDYVPKPFEPRELLARIKAVLRRRQSGVSVADSGAATLRFGRLEIDRNARAVRIDGGVRALTSHQFDLLCLLAERPGRVLNREQIMDLLRGEPFDAMDRSIDVHIARIRNAIEDDARHPKRIITVRGAGYVFSREQDVA
ncbi:response regulator transcription factor [soil metagenome]